MVFRRKKTRDDVFAVGKTLRVYQIETLSLVPVVEQQDEDRIMPRWEATIGRVVNAKHCGREHRETVC